MSDAIVDHVEASFETCSANGLPAPLTPKWTWSVKSSPHVMTVDDGVSVMAADGASTLITVDVAGASVVTGAVDCAVATRV